MMKGLKKCNVSRKEAVIGNGYLENISPESYRYTNLFGAMKNANGSSTWTELMESTLGKSV
jgi:hypothetical protein